MPVSFPSRAGVKYVSNLPRFAKKPLTVEDLRKFSKTLYGKGLFLKMYALVFNSSMDHYVFDPEGNPDEITQLTIRDLFKSEKFSSDAAGQTRLFDKFFYGPSIFNPLWAR